MKPSKSAPLLVSLALLAVLTVGCASGLKYSQYRPTLAPPTAGNGRIWFYRPSAFGAAVQPAVKLDDVVVGNAVPHGFFQVETQPGSHEVSARTEWKHKASVKVTEHAETYVRLDMMFGLFVGHVIPREVPEEQALKDLQDLHLAAKEAQK
jgi:hypothetical protein